jgi:SAM-dependent methyltransferase
MSASTTYDAAFYAAQAEGSLRSAHRVAPIVWRAAKQPQSIIDVGCGVGTWLAAFRALGAQRIVGLDGAYVDRRQLQIDSTDFREVDLNQPVSLSEKFDLAMSLEVAEHLLPERSESFVSDLVRLAPVVLFSAAIPDQAGADHINERWQDEWAALFAEQGYRAVDVVRTEIWNDPGVQPWYAQNALLYVSDEVDIAADSDLPLRVVHPRLFQDRIAQEHAHELGFRETTLELVSAARRAASYRLARAGGSSRKR